MKWLKKLLALFDFTKWFDFKKKDKKEDKGFSEPERFTWTGNATWEASIETHGIKPQSGAAGPGKEFIFWTFFGHNFKRLLMANMGGGRHHIRLYADGMEDGYRIRALNVHDLCGVPWHKWTLRGAGGKVSLYLDDKKVGTWIFPGVPEGCWAGGNELRSRCFKGTWRNFTHKEG